MTVEEDSMGLIMPEPKTILVAEDEPLVLKMISTMLERLGHIVLAASTPKEAIFMAGQFDNKIDLVITDVIMPRMNGRELAKRLMASQPGLTILYMSGYPANIISNQSVLDEKMCFLQKPFSKKELAAKIREIMEIN